MTRYGKTKGVRNGNPAPEPRGKVWAPKKKSLTLSNNEVITARNGRKAGSKAVVQMEAEECDISFNPSFVFFVTTYIVHEL